MSQLIALLLVSLHYGAAHAAEIHDAPIPEPNYLGIIAFFAICIGCGWWFYRAVMKNTEIANQANSKISAPDK